MDDLTNKLSSLLNDPAGMEKIRSIAQNLFENEPEKAQNDTPDLTRLLPLISKFSSAEDDRVRLLAALRPYLSPERQKRTDRAVKILKAASLVPLLQESGIFEF